MIKNKVEENVETKKESVIDKIRKTDPDNLLYWSLQIGWYAVCIAFLAGTVTTAKRAVGLMYLAKEDGIMWFDEDQFNGWAMRQSPKRIKRFWKTLNKTEKLLKLYK